MNKELISAEIIKVASYYQGMHEIQSNTAWSNKEKSDRLVAAMHKAGWQEGWPYCASFVEAVLREAYANLKAPQTIQDLIAEKYTPSSITTATNFASKLTRVPEPGATFFMRLGDSWKGHEGICSSGVINGRFNTIEGNTSPAAGSSAALDREGDGVYAKNRALNLTKSSSILYLVGFLPPITW